VATPNNSRASSATLQTTLNYVPTRSRSYLLYASSGQTIKLLDFERPPNEFNCFSRDGKGVVYPVSEHGVDNLWLQPLDGSKGKQLTNFNSEEIGNGFHWSPNGSKLAIIRGHLDSDVVLIRDAQQ